MPTSPKLEIGKTKRGMYGLLPKIDKEMWRTELGLTDEQVDELAELIETADLTNMFVNELMARVEGIVGFRNKVAKIFDISPTMVTRRLKHGIGASDRVHPPRESLYEITKELESKFDAYPYTEHLKRILSIYGFYGNDIYRILEIYTSDIDRFEQPSEFYQMLRSFGVGAKRAKLITKLFFEIEVIPDVE